jgi:hypothetical protein
MASGQLGEDRPDASAAVYCRGVRSDDATILGKERCGPVELGGIKSLGESAGHLLGDGPQGHGAAQIRRFFMLTPRLLRCGIGLIFSTIAQPPPPQGGVSIQQTG